MRNYFLTVVVCALGVVGVGRCWGQGDAAQSPPAQNQSPENRADQDQPGSDTGAQKNSPGQTSGGAQTPEETPKKDESGNPVVAVASMTKDAATTGLLKARDWESSRIAGIYVGRNRKLVTLTAEQRREIYLRETLTTPEAYMKRMFAALIDQARGAPSQWQGGIGGYAERWASREGQFITANSLAALGNAKLGYEVRYDQCKCKGWPRVKHAVLRNFVTYDRSEENLRPQWALYGGAFAGGLVASSWKPKSENVLVNGGWALLGQAAYGTLLNLVTEFSREINRKQGVK